MQVQQDLCFRHEDIYTARGKGRINLDESNNVRCDRCSGHDKAARGCRVLFRHLHLAE